jgi:alkylation response protein AidB-like acyl-CoA dehydrogenase
MSIFDKNIGAEKMASLEFAEQQRENNSRKSSFLGGVFLGRVDWSLIHPFPHASADDKKIGDDYILALSEFLRKNLDPDEVDRTGVIPEEVYRGLADLRAFAIKVPREYGGLGFSQVNYNRIMHMVSSYCGSTAVLLSAHQSIGVPQPLKIFGTSEQKKKYFPAFVKGAISAFALTEPGVGSDPRRMTTTAVPDPDGQHFLINGEKLWCTNGLIAKVIVVMAVTPPKIVNGREHKQITAFLVETDSPGFEIVHRCHFMGLKGIQNGLIRFHDVRVHRDHIIGTEGDGLKLALITLNTGRLTLPAASVGISKWCLQVSRRWSNEREQWGGPIGHHQSIAVKLSYMASHTFAMDAVTWLTSAMADDRSRDIRLEAAVAKYFCTVHSWKIVDETMQIRGGQGYENAISLKARGMRPWAVERVLRDVRINLIIEGTTEIMRLFIAREAMDPHLSRAMPLMEASGSLGQQCAVLTRTLGFYGLWYPGLWLFHRSAAGRFTSPLDGHARFVERYSRRLARWIIHSMIRYQKKLESNQLVLNRIVDVGTELFAMSAVCSYAQTAGQSSVIPENAVALADLYCRHARTRISRLFLDGWRNHDRVDLNVAKGVLNEEYTWLENDIIQPS